MVLPGPSAHRCDLTWLRSPHLESDPGRSGLASTRYGRRGTRVVSSARTGMSTSNRRPGLTFRAAAVCIQVGVSRMSVDLVIRGLARLTRTTIGFGQDAHVQGTN